MSEYKLKPCPFCGGEVTVAEGSYRQTRWMYVTRGNKENRCNCHVFMESKTYYFDSSEKTRKESKPTLSKRGISESNKN